MPARSIFWRLMSSGVPGPINEALGTDQLITVSDIEPGTGVQINIGDGIWRSYTTLPEDILDPVRVGTLLNPSLAMSLGPLSPQGPRPFVNNFKMAEPWGGGVTGGGYRTFEQLVADGIVTIGGDVISVPTGLDNVGVQMLRGLMPNMGGGNRWRLMWDGTGAVQMNGGQNVNNSVPNQLDFDMEPNGSNFVFALVTAVTTGPLTNWRLVNHDDLDQYAAGKVFRDEFLEEIRNYRCIRFDNWIDIVENRSTTWDSRPRISDAFWIHGTRRMPIEICVDLCNEIGADMWLCLPFMATNDYISQCSILVRDRLNTNRHCWIEYAHKCWDAATPAFHYCAAQGDLMFGGTGGQNYIEWYGVQTANVARLWRAAWGATERLHTVAQTQGEYLGLEFAILNAPRWVAQQAGRQPPHTVIDAYGFHAQIDGDMAYGGRYAMIEGWRTTLPETEVFNRLRDQSLTGAWAANTGRTVQNSVTRWQYHREKADEFGMDLVCVDGGSHLHAGGDAFDNQAHLDMLARYHYSPQFATVAQAILEGWESVGGDLFSWSVHSRVPDRYVNIGLQRWEGDHNIIWDVVHGWNEDHQGPTGRGNAFIGPFDLIEGAGPVDPDPDPEPGEPSLRQASASTDLKVHSGHSLVDTYINEGESFPGFLPELFMEQFGEAAWIFEGTDYKDTLPGSPMSIRWNDADDPLGAVFGISRYQTMVVTEGGPPFRLNSENTAEYITATLQYAMNFAENAYRNGDSGAGAEPILWSIWPNVTGWMTDDPEDNQGSNWRDLGGFRPVTVEYGRTFRYIADYVTWKMRQIHPELGDDYRMWVFPGHAWFVRVYDDIQDGLVPGMTDHTDLFRDSIHPNPTCSYGLSVFMHTLLYQVDARALTYRPTFVSTELDTYFKRVAWEVANSEESVGMGGTANAAPVFIGGTTPDPMPTYSFVDPIDPEEPVDPEEPTDPVDPPAGGLLHRLAAPMAMTAGNYPTITMDNAGPAGAPFYIAFSFTPDASERQSSAFIQLLDTADNFALEIVERIDLNGLYVRTNFDENHLVFPWVAADGPLIMEIFIDPTLTPPGYAYSGTTEDVMTSDLALTPASINRILLGSPDWGGSISTGTLNDLIIYSRIPTQAERDAILLDLVG